MAASIDVNLPKSHLPRFPDRCVVCEECYPNSSVWLITGTIGWWTWILWWFGKPFMVKAPACRYCGWKLTFLRFFSLLVTIAIAFVAVWFIWPLFEDHVPKVYRKLVVAALALICLSPQIAFEIFFARPFEVTAYAESVDYEFTSLDYAVEFASLNKDAEWVKINGNEYPGATGE